MDCVIYVRHYVEKLNMPSRQRTQSKDPGSTLVEILHIDTDNSRKLYKEAGLNSEEKSRAQGLLKAKFLRCCESEGGTIHTWKGDGGFGFFPSDRAFGKSVDAAKNFLDNFDDLNYQTAIVFDIPSFSRSVRITAHRGEIYITKDAGIDSADPKSFDDFIKNERKFAPELNDFFTTKVLYDQLPAKKKEIFQLYGRVKADSLTTSIYRMSIRPESKTRNFFEINKKKSIELTPVEWGYLKSRMTNNQMNVAARNKITRGLINVIDYKTPPEYPISSKDLLELTLNALYNYLRSASAPEIIFRISYWRFIQEKERNYLQIVSSRYPDNNKPNAPNRRLQAENLHYQVCCSFTKKEPLATSCVAVARQAGQWLDFDSISKKLKRELCSALQIPVFYVASNGEKITQGVLCLNTNKSDTFLSEEIALWQDDLVGYLINISLSERLRNYEELSTNIGREGHGKS